MAKQQDAAWSKVVSKLIDLFKRLPLAKLSANQTFDLIFDLLMLAWAGVALWSNLDANRKFVLAILCPIFMACSFWFNKPIPRARH